MVINVVNFLALMLTALAFVPSGAHLFELPNKMGLEAGTYFAVQGIYRGWALFGVAWIGAMLANVALAYGLRRQRWPFMLAVAAFLCLAASLVIFGLWTEPANRATGYWTNVPANWETLRRQWEYSHAANALLTFAALCCVALATLARRR
jgi:hypothetical protein